MHPRICVPWCSIRPIPPRSIAELSDAWLLQRSFEMFGRICELADECTESAAELNERLEGAFARVERESIKLSVRDPDTGRDIAVVYDHEDLAWLLFEAMYQWDAIPGLPESVAALAEGRLDSHMREPDPGQCGRPARRYDQRCRGQFGRLSRCRTGRPAGCRAAVAAVSPRGRRSNVSTGSIMPAVTGPRVRRRPRFGRRWCRMSRPCLLAGEFDPVTPPEWAERPVATFSRGAPVRISRRLVTGCSTAMSVPLIWCVAFSPIRLSARPPECLDQL